MQTRQMLGVCAAILLAGSSHAQQGLTLNHYQFGGNPSTTLVDPLSNLLALTPDFTSNYYGAISYPVTSSGLSLPLNSNYVLLWTGWFLVPSAGTYTFQTGSDDGSMFYVDVNGDGQFTSSSPDERVVNNNSYQGIAYKQGTVSLQARSYRIAIAYYQGTGGESMYANYMLPGASSYTAVDTTSGRFFMTDPSSGAPLLVNQPVTNVQTASARMQGYLMSTGGSPATVSVFWGTSDSGTNVSAWSHTNTWPAGAWSTNSYPATNVTGLSSATDYYYTFFGQNASNSFVATPSQYFITGELGLSVTDGTLGNSITDKATVVVSRPAGCVAQSLTVNYTLGGTAVNGADYSISPASGSLVITAGTTSATITLTPKLPLNTSGSSKSILLALAPGAYAIGGAGSASFTLANTVYVPPALVLTGDLYADEDDSGIIKRSSDNSVVLAPYMVNTNVDGITYAYMYVLASLNMNGYTIWGKKTPSSQADVPGGYWLVAGDVTGNGTWDYGKPNSYYGSQGLRVEAGGTITVSNIVTETHYGGNGSVVKGAPYFWAKNGWLTINGTVWVCGGNGNSMYPAVLRSEGAPGNRGIRILGTVTQPIMTTERTNFNQTVTRNFSIYNRSTEGDAASLFGFYTQGDVQLAGGFYQPCSANGSRFLITGSYTDGTARAGNVSIGGDLIMYATGFYPNIYAGYPGVAFAGFGSGNNWVAITAANVRVQGRIDLRLGTWSGDSERIGGVFIDSMSDAIVDGCIDTYGTLHSYNYYTTPGPVWIKGKHIAVCGTNENGESIRTKPVEPPAGGYATGHGTYQWNRTRMGDGDVTLIGTDTSAGWFDPRKPFTGGTSSILVSGKIVTAYCNIPEIKGNVYISGVGVYLGGDLVSSNSPPVTNNFHYGITKYGVKTHLVEKGVQWTGSPAPHNMNYGPATNYFFADVPYAGNYGVQGMLLIIQ